MEYELPDDWWNASGVQYAGLGEHSYRSGPSPNPNQPVFQVSVRDIEPCTRKGSHGVFNDSPEFGAARDRVIALLSGFSENSAIPPIEVSELPPGSGHRYKLIHGAHRLYCAIAVGYSHVPAIKVVDFFGTYPTGATPAAL